jgi:uncharacterized protein YjiS (DUF1127 family)
MEQTMPNSALALARPRFGLSRIAGQVWRLILAFELALQVRSERRLLAGLDERTLKDIGFNRGDACAEAHRSFWDVPADRVRI